MLPLPLVVSTDAEVHYWIYWPKSLDAPIIHPTEPSSMADVHAITMHANPDLLEELQVSTPGLLLLPSLTGNVIRTSAALTPGLGTYRLLPLLLLHSTW